MTEGLTSLGRVLTEAKDPLFGYQLYLPFDQVWDLETAAAVLPDIEADEGLPDRAREGGLEPAIGINSVYEVYLNLESQGLPITPELLLEAFLHYYDCDAFIEFSRADSWDDLGRYG